MRGAARILLLLLVPRVAPLSVAFKIETHWSITAQALTDPAVLTELAPYSFSFDTIDEIKNANACVDLGVELFSHDDEMDKPCVPPSNWVGDVGTQTFHQQFRAPEDHFDDEQILKGAARLRMLKARVVEYAKSGQFIESRKLLGMALHTIQDFYAHSNWVELGNSTIFAALDDVNGKIPQFSDPNSKSFRLAGLNEDVCVTRIEVHDTAGAQEVGQPPVKVKPYPVKVIDGGTLMAKSSDKGYVLTSGFFFDLSQDSLIAKCQHGAGANIPGINKDDTTTSHGIYFDQARQLAFEHSKKFVLDCLTKLHGDAVARAGLTGAKNWGCDCPEPVTEHIHQRGWLDVNAQKMNDTGMIVKANDFIKIEVNPKGLIVWGRAGTLFGQELTARPQGDPDITPYNHLGWVQPPLPQYPIGMLFAGVVLDEDVTSTPGIFDKMSAFPVSVGGVFVMPVGGKLFLSVNDGYLGNNRGCFQARLTRVL